MRRFSMYAHQDEPGDRDRATSRTRWTLAGFLAVAAFFLVAEHQAHLSGLLIYLPYLLLLACPLMHLFHHGGHGRHGKHDNRSDRGDAGAVDRSTGEPR
jgi:Protein of unknown function (DUF2933)